MTSRDIAEYMLEREMERIDAIRAGDYRRAADARLERNIAGYLLDAWYADG